MIAKSKDKTIESSTVGQLIGKYLDNKDKYANVIPQKHEALLSYSNTFNVFSTSSARPKITRPIATTFLNMTFAFLFDETIRK